MLWLKREQSSLGTSLWPNAEVYDSQTIAHVKISLWLTDSKPQQHCLFTQQLRQKGLSIRYNYKYNSMYSTVLVQWCKTVQ